MEAILNENYVYIAGIFIVVGMMIAGFILDKLEETPNE